MVFKTLLAQMTGLVIAVFLLQGCGGSDGSGGSEPVSIGTLWITSVAPVLYESTDPGTGETIYTTSSDEIQIAGKVFGLTETYAQACSDVDTGPLLLTVTWHNSTTGAEGGGSAMWLTECSLWCTCVPYFHLASTLEYGENVIDVVVRHEDGGYATETFIVNRVASAPNNITVTPGDSEMTLDWEEVPHARAYNLYFTTDYNFDMETASKIENITPPFTHMLLNNMTTYSYRLTSVNDENIESAPSRLIRATAGWHTTLLDTHAAFDPDNELALAIDSNNNVHIESVYRRRDSNTTEMRYLTNKSGSWQSSVLQTDAAPPDAAMVVDKSNVVHIVHAGGQLTHWQNASGSWSSSVIDANQSCSASVAIDFYDAIHVLHQSIAGLKYTTNAPGAWTTVTLNDAPFVCPGYGQSAIVIESFYNVERFAYVVGNALYFQYGVNGAVMPLDDADVAYIAMAEGIYDDPRVVASKMNGYYYLKHYFNNGYGWQVENAGYAGSGYLVQAKPVLVTDDNKLAHVASECDSYYLCYSTNQSGAWTYYYLNTTRNTYGAAYLMPAIGVDASGRVYIAYYKQTAEGADLYYTYSY
ncbi:hypothetical protein ACXWTF_08155 [Thiomicrolovo sp. ZZH C-3]